MPLRRTARIRSVEGVHGPSDPSIPYLWECWFRRARHPGVAQSTAERTGYLEAFSTQTLRFSLKQKASGV